MRYLSMIHKRALCRALYAAGLLTVAIAPVRAGLVNQYTFNDGTVNDSGPGAAHGTLVDNTGIAKYSGGALDLRANNGLNSGRDFAQPTTVGAFVDLPNGIFNSAVGADGQVTLEMWLEVETHNTWAEAFVFGKSEGAEGTASGGNGQQYVALVPRSDSNDFRGITRRTTAPEQTAAIGSPTPLATGVRHHAVFVLDHLDTNGGAFPNGTASLYLNGGTPGKAEIRPFLNEIQDVNNWLGRSLWGNDNLLDGLIDEFRIYDHALSAAEVSASKELGPVPAPVPVLTVNRMTGAMSLATPSGIATLKGYSISSPGGALNTATWSSIDAGNAFDGDGTWTLSSLTASSIAESVTGGVTDGATLSTVARGIGTPWLRTPTQDITFTYTLENNVVTSGQVQYIGNTIGRSDLNGDGLLTPADWTIFSTNSFKTFTGELTVAAYLKGDLDGDLDNDLRDFRLFKTDYIAANGGPAFAALTGVPEPAAGALAALGAIALFASQRRQAA
jgi:hypothetical protein